ncbi:MAG: hypothetical protein ACKPCP_17600 [Sphaerospermopsis kisseleviana]
MYQKIASDRSQYSKFPSEILPSPQTAKNTDDNINLCVRIQVIGNREQGIVIYL